MGLGGWGVLGGSTVGGASGVCCSGRCAGLPYVRRIRVLYHKAALKLSGALAGSSAVTAAAAC